MGEPDSSLAFCLPLRGVVVANNSAVEEESVLHSVKCYFPITISAPGGKYKVSESERDELEHFSDTGALISELGAAHHRRPWTGKNYIYWLHDLIEVVSWVLGSRCRKTSHSGGKGKENGNQDGVMEFGVSRSSAKESEE